MRPALLEQAESLVMRGEIDPAIQKLSEFLNADFFHDEALFMLGACLMAKGMSGLSAVVTSAAVDARASKGRAFPEALLNLGGAYKAEHHNATAERIWQDALKHETLKTERSKIYVNMAGLYVNEGQPERAIELCDLALAEDPENHGAHANRGMACLELGRWREGWQGWLHTYATGDRNRRAYPGIPAWDGSPDKTLIVWGDQGVGDEIYYASCLADLAKVSKRIILDCHPRLDRLFTRSFPYYAVHGTRKDLTALPWVKECGADAAVALSDLPAYFRNEGEWTGQSYLVPAVTKELICREGETRIGLSWSGGTKKTRNDLRSLPLAALEPIVRAMPDARFFSLQYTPDAAREVCEFEERTGLRIAHYPGWVECRDYDRTASFVAALDLVITVCTTIHHLGGAMGVPTWTMVPSRPSWRYGVRGESLPWYGSARLFRQETDGDWAGVVETIAEKLRARA